MSVLKELEGKQMKTTTQQTRGMQQISKVTNKFHLKTTDTSHRPQQFTSRMQRNKNTLTPKVEEGRQIRVEIETKCLWRRIYRVIHRLLIIHTKSTTFLVEMDKILLSFTPSSLCVPFSLSVQEAGSFWVEANSLMRTTTFWVGFLDCWRTCALTGRSHPELAGTESIIGQERLKEEWYFQLSTLRVYILLNHGSPSGASHLKHPGRCGDLWANWFLPTGE